MHILASPRSMHASSAPPAQPAIHWGWLLVVTGTHAAGLFALSGLGGESDAETRAADTPAISVQLLPPDTPAPAVTTPTPNSLPAEPTPQPKPRGKAIPPAPPISRQGPATSTIGAMVGKPPPETNATPSPANPAQAPSKEPPTVEGMEVSAPSSNEPRQRPVTRSDSAVAGPPSTDGTGPLVAARFDAAYLQNPAPTYPKVSRRRGEAGKVMLRVRVLGDGRADAVEIAESSGHPRLDEAAQETVRGWRFVPAHQGETPVDSWLRVPIVFRLED